MLSDTEFSDMLQLYNPWWTYPFQMPGKRISHKRYVFNEAMKLICDPSARHFVVIASAPLMGKTTAMYQMIEALLEQGVASYNILYMNFDDPKAAMLCMNDVLDFYESMCLIDGERYLFFDDIQGLPDWEKWMEIFYGSRKDLRVIAAFSGDIHLYDKSYISSVYTILSMPPITFYEYCHLNGAESLLPMKGIIRLSSLYHMRQEELGRIVNLFPPLLPYFKRYLLTDEMNKIVLQHMNLFFEGTGVSLQEKIEGRSNLCINVYIEVPVKKILFSVVLGDIKGVEIEDNTETTHAFYLTMDLGCYGKVDRPAGIPVMQIPAVVFLYLLGKSMYDGLRGKI